MQNRLRSKVLWTAIFSLIILVSKNIFHYEIPQADIIVNTLLTVLIALGVINNPTDDKFI